MPYYELLCLASGRLTRAQLHDLIRKTCRAFLDNGAVISRIDALGATGHGPRKLAYRIRRNQVTYKTGFYINVCAIASPSALAEVSRQLGIDERVLRSLPIRKPLLDVLKPSVNMDAPPPVGKGLDPNDPEYELKKFMMEFDREFPDGVLRWQAGEEEVELGEGGKGEGVDESGGMAMDGVLASLKASSVKQDSAEEGLAWLARLGKESREPATPSKR